MLKQVLVPLDGSKLAEEALDYALNIVEPNGKVILVCAVEVPDVSVYGGYYSPSAAAEYKEAEGSLLPFARNYLQGIADRLTQQHLSVKVETEIGDPAEIISLIACKHHVDAIVMSTHGRSGISRWIFGSVANKVLNAKPCPVFIIPSKEAQKPK